MKTILFDSHTHVNFQPFQADYQAVIQRALADNIWLNNVGSQLVSSRRAVEIAEQYKEGVWATIGLHPIHVLSNVVEEQIIDGKKQIIQARAEKFDYEKYKRLALSSKKVIAIGECGLDYYHLRKITDQVKRQDLIKQQLANLELQLKLALELNLAVVIHCRDAADQPSATAPAYVDLLKLLNKYQNKLRGVIHCYTGAPEFIEQFLELGFYIGFTGIISFPNAPLVKQALEKVPLDRLLIETDAPYLAPVPMRGKRNEPAFVRYVAQAAAEVKQVDFEQLAKQTTNNALGLFRI